MGLNDVTYYELPMSPAEFTRERVSALRNLIIPTDLAAGDFVAYHSSLDYLNAYANSGVRTVPEDRTKRTKLWCLRETSKSAGRYLQFALDDNGNPKKYSIIADVTAGKLTGNPETYQQPGTLTEQGALMMAVLGKDMPQFYFEYGGYFEGGIPLFEWVDMSDDQVHEINFGFGSNRNFVQIPLGGPGLDVGKVSTWPQSLLPAFHPVTGKLCFFKIAEFIQKVPKKAPGAAGVVGTGGWEASFEVIGDLARTLVLFSPNETSAQVGERIALVARKTK